MTRKNPTSPIRRGFTYQDTWGLLLCAKILRSPSRYKWIQFETIPDDVQDKEYYLDDIIICDQADNLRVYQIKRAQDSLDQWDWEDLLKKEEYRNGSLKDSLLQKWFKSFKKSERVTFGIFITNRSSSQKISACIREKKLSLEKVGELYPEILKEIEEQLGTRQEIDTFFSISNFDLANLT